MSVNFYTGANNITVKNTLTDELKTSYDEAVGLVNKLGADATVEGSVAQRLAAIVANAPEKYDTLKEIATWIESDTDGAAKMQADIAALEADKLDKSSVSSWAKASTKPDYTASEINLANGTSVESAFGTINSNLKIEGSYEAWVTYPQYSAWGDVYGIVYIPGIRNRIRKGTTINIKCTIYNGSGDATTPTEETNYIIYEDWLQVHIAYNSKYAGKPMVFRVTLS